MFGVQHLFYSVYENMTTWVNADNDVASSGTNVDGEHVIYTDDSGTSGNESDTNMTSPSNNTESPSDQCPAGNDSESEFNSPFVFTFEASVEESTFDDHNANATPGENGNLSELTCEAVFILDSNYSNSETEERLDNAEAVHHKISENLESRGAKSPDEQDNNKLNTPGDVNHGYSAKDTYTCTSSKTTEKHSWTEEHISTEEDGFALNCSDESIVQTACKEHNPVPCAQSSDIFLIDKTGEISTCNAGNAAEDTGLADNSATEQTLLMETVFSTDSIPSTMAHSPDNLSQDKTELSSEKCTESEFTRIASSIEKKYKLNAAKMEVEGNKRKQDKFTVSFNSDTSDSDSDSPVKCKSPPIQNGIVEKSPKAEPHQESGEKGKKKKKDKEKESKEGDKVTKKSKKPEKRSEDEVNDKSTEKMSKSEKSSKKEKKSEKKEKKAKTDKEDEKGEKKEKKKSKSKESKKKTDDSDSSVSCNGGMPHKSVSPETKENEDSKITGDDLTADVIGTIQNMDTEISISTEEPFKFDSTDNRDTESTEKLSDTGMSEGTCDSGISEDVCDTTKTDDKSGKFDPNSAANGEILLDIKQIKCEESKSVSETRKNEAISPSDVTVSQSDESNAVQNLTAMRSDEPMQGQGIPDPLLVVTPGNVTETEDSLRTELSCGDQTDLSNLQEIHKENDVTTSENTELFEQSVDVDIVEPKDKSAPEIEEPFSKKESVTIVNHSNKIDSNFDHDIEINITETPTTDNKSDEMGHAEESPALEKENRMKEDEQVTGDSNPSDLCLGDHTKESQGDRIEYSVHEKKPDPGGEPDFLQESNSCSVSTFSHKDLSNGQTVHVRSEPQNSGNSSVSTPPTSALHLPLTDQNTTLATEQNTSKTWEDYSSQNIKSIYFSEEFEQASNMADSKPNQPDEKAVNDITVEKQTNLKEIQITNNEQIPMQARERQQIKQNGDLEEKLSPVFDFSATATRRTLKTFSQDSYEAAVNRAFASTPRDERFSADTTLFSPKKTNDYMSAERSSVSESARKTEHKQNSFSNYESDLRMSSNEDGRDALERTTTFLAGDRQSTDELIKRILAESRGETWPVRSERDQRMHTAMDENQGGHDLSENRRIYGVEDTYIQDRRQRAGSGPFEAHVPEVSDNRGAEQRHGMYVREEYEDERLRSSKSPSNYTDQSHSEAMDNHRHKYRSGFMQKQAAIYDDYAESFRTAATRYAHDMDDDDDDRYSSRRRQAADDVVYIPDEDFIPKKAEDTDEVVQERTAEIRNVVDNQNQVLTRLKSASDSFDELQDEIKQIKQQFLESSMRRSLILDDIEYEREQWDYEMAQAAGYRPGPGGQTGGQYGPLRRNASARALDPDENEFDMPPQYRPGVYSTRQAGAELDRDLESDRIVSGALQNLAVASSGAGSVGVRDDLSLDTEQRYGTGRSHSSYLSSATRRGRSASMFEDSDYGYDLAGSVRPKLSTRFTANGLGGDDEDDDAESYKSPNLPSYRRYDSYGTDRGDVTYGLSGRDYTSSYSNRYSADVGRYGDDSSSASGDSGRYGHRSLLRSQTVDSYTYDKSPARNKYSAPPSSGFSSRFLDKVRQKKAAGEEVKRDKPFSSRFLGTKTTFEGPYSTKSYSSSYSSTSFKAEESSGSKFEKSEKSENEAAASSEG